jgi:hypothetical protein
MAWQFMFALSICLCNDLYANVPWLLDNGKPIGFVDKLTKEPRQVQNMTHKGQLF